MPLDTWAREMAIHPCAWNQVVNPLRPYPDECNSVWPQNGWYDYAAGTIIGRDDVADAITSAEEDINNALGYPLAPTYTCGDEAEWPYPRNGVQTAYPTIQASQGMVIAGGRETLSPVALDAPVVYTDRDGDGVDDTAQITITPAQMLAAGASYFELAVYYSYDYVDYIFAQLDDTERIRPLHIIRNPADGVVTISGHRCQFVRPELWLDFVEIDQSNDLNFVSMVNVFRRYTDPSQQAQIIYKPGPNDCNATSLCIPSCQDACMQITDERLGELKVTPATYSPTTGLFTSTQLTSYPSSVRLWYLAGYYRQRNGYSSWIEADWMEPRLSKAITALSLSRLPDAVCGCSQTRARYAQWTEETAIDNLDAAMAQEYFGIVTRGSAYAASVVRRMQPIYGTGNV